MVQSLLKLLRFNKFSLVTQSIFCSSSKGSQPRKSVSFSTRIMFKSAVFNLEDATKDQLHEFLDSFDTVLTDCDGKREAFCMESWNYSRNICSIIKYLIIIKVFCGSITMPFLGQRILWICCVRREREYSMWPTIPRKFAVNLLLKLNNWALLQNR